MAIMIPSVIKRGATSGERRVFETLKEGLPDDCVVYYEPFIDGRKPDYVVIIPSLGVLVLEVKDYKLSTLSSVNTDKWKLKLSTGIEEVPNPLNQARNYAFLITNKLKQDPGLTYVKNGARHLKFSYGYGVVLTNIDSLEVIENDLHTVIPMNLMLTSDDLAGSEEYDESDLFESLSAMFSVRLNTHQFLGQNEVDRIRCHLFPEVILNETKSYKQDNLLKLKSLKAMSLYQESLAKQLGEGHRLIRGVAGSGKTAVLVARAKILSQMNPEWKIVIICFGVVMSSYIARLVEDYDNIKVMTFYEFLYTTFREGASASIDNICDAIERGIRKPLLYDAILIDEAQDFEESWFRLVSLCLNKETASMLIVEDKAQDIYRRKTSISKLTGLDFRGRSRILNINYRNTRNIAEFSWSFYKTFFGQVKSEDIIEPVLTKRVSIDPIVKSFRYCGREYAWVALKIKELVESKKVKFSDVAILYRIKKYNGIDHVEVLMNYLRGTKIPHVWVSRDRKSKESFNKEEDTVKILTIDSSKGLDFKVVFVVNVDNLPFPLEQDVEREASLLYIGMTRSTDLLFLTYSGESVFTKYLSKYEEVGNE